MKKVLSGNEALAFGAWCAGVHFASGYPGTPSTEILEALAFKFPEIYAEWAPNEKVALESAIGASLAGARAFATMKHVGLNVAADPLMTIASCGITGGLVIITGDDPGAHSSQNEQDNRFYGKFAQIPILEPSNSQEAKDFMIKAFEISEEFDTPVLLRMTTRICHGKSVVEMSGKHSPAKIIPFERNPAKFIPVPVFAIPNHRRVLERIEKLTEFAATSDLNTLEKGQGEVGFISTGAAYNYLKEFLPNSPILKLGLSFPLNEKLIKDFAASVKRLVVVEELEPFLENQIKIMGLKVEGKQWFSAVNELNPDNVLNSLVRAKLLPATKLNPKTHLPKVEMPRPPIFCAGCPHRGLFYSLKKLKAIVHGDIGCYSLGFAPPLQALDTIVCMGAGLSLAHGNSIIHDLYAPDDKRPIFAVIGDSTFFHSGMTSLINAVYNQSKATFVILDNRITAMTGTQDNPGTGRTLMKKEAPQADLAAICKALGVKRVVEINPYNLKKCEEVLRQEAAADETSVIISKKSCIQILKGKKITPFQVNEDLCIGCGTCRSLGCPAVLVAGEIPGGKLKYSTIDQSMCFACSMCAQICPKSAIKIKKGENK